MSIEGAALEIVRLKKTASEALAQGDVDTFLEAYSNEVELLKKRRVIASFI